MRLSKPIFVRPVSTTCGPTLVPSPISTYSPTIEYGPTETLSPSRAPGWTMAVG